MTKDILFNEEARQKMLIGINKVSDPVKSTVGPKGNNVVIDQHYGDPIVANDGVTIAKSIELEDTFERIGAKLIQQASIKTDETAGDGTTTTVILAQAIIKEGLKNVAAGTNPMAIKRGIDKAVVKVVERLKEMSKPISGNDDIKKIATISSGDEKIGQIIADLLNKVGNDGVIEVEDSNIVGVSSEVMEGMHIDRGYISPFMMTESSKKSVFEETFVIVTDKKINSIFDIDPIIKQIVDQKVKFLTIFSDGMSDDVLKTLIANHLQGGFHTLAIKSPGNTLEEKREILKDIASITGATFISSETGDELKTMILSDLGSAKKIVADEHTTVIIGGGKGEEFNTRVSELKGMVKAMDNGHEKDKVVDRLAKLIGGVGIMRVGAATEVELRDKKLRIEDAVKATKSAIEEGVVSGGGIALLDCQSLFDGPQEDSDEQIGINIIRKSLAYPIKQIAENAGENGDVIIEKIHQSLDECGWNAEKNEYGDMFEMGIIDPTKVVRCAIENAASVAGMFLTTSACVAEKNQEKK